MLVQDYALQRSLMTASQQGFAAHHCQLQCAEKLPYVQHQLQRVLVMALTVAAGPAAHCSLASPLSSAMSRLCMSFQGRTLCWGRSSASAQSPC